MWYFIDLLLPSGKKHVYYVLKNRKPISSFLFYKV